MIVAIPPADVPRVWDQVGPMLQMALDKGDSSFLLEDVKRFLESGDHILLVALKDKEIQAAFTLDKLVYPQKKVLSIFLVGGTGMEEWEEEVMSVIYTLAKELKVDAIYSNGRDGWTRKMEKYGYYKIFTVLERKVA